MKRNYIVILAIAAALIAFVMARATGIKAEPIATSEPFYQTIQITPSPTSTPEPTVEPTVEPTSTPEPTMEPTYETPTELLEEMAVQESDSLADEAVYMAKVIYGEARGIYSQTEQACVAWTILNRVDAGFGESIKEVCTAPAQFCYNANFPTVDDYGRDLVALALDVIERWQAEKNFGTVESGRVLPKDYYYFGGDDGHNWFRNTYEYSPAWDYTLASPYDT